MCIINVGDRIWFFLLSVLVTISILSPLVFASVQEFEYAFRRTLQFEGTTYVVDSNGFGSKFGINARWYSPLKGFPKFVRQLTLAQAKTYYKRNYWDTLKLDGMIYSTNYKSFIFDCHIQHGRALAEHILGLSSGNLRHAKQLRIAHINSWLRQKPKFENLREGLINRVNSF